MAHDMKAQIVRFRQLPAAERIRRAQEIIPSRQHVRRQSQGHCRFFRANR